MQEAGQLLVSMLAAAPPLAAELGELLDALGESWVINHYTLVLSGREPLECFTSWRRVCGTANTYVTWLVLRTSITFVGMYPGREDDRHVDCCGTPAVRIIALRNAQAQLVSLA